MGCQDLQMRIIGWIQMLFTNQTALTNKNPKLRVRVGMLETRCELQDAEIALLDARITQACGMLNLE